MFLRIPIRTIGVFFALGILLILLWLYIGDKSKQQLQQQNKGKTIRDPGNNNLVQHQQKSCICPICNREQTGVCLNQNGNYKTVGLQYKIYNWLRVTAMLNTIVNYDRFILQSHSVCCYDQ